MKISLGWRLFFAVLMSLMTVVAAALLLMREKVSHSFADYALKIELDRLQEVGDAIQERYAQHGDWSFLPTQAAQKQMWINQELLRLYQAKVVSAKPSRDAGIRQRPTRSEGSAPSVHIVPAAPAAPATAQAPALPAAPMQPAAPATTVSKTISTGEISAEAVVAKKSMLPPLPPPPPPPPPPPVNLPTAASAPDPVAIADSEREFQNLNSRISLVDADLHYLAGRPLDQSASGLRPLFHQDKLIAYLRVQKSRIPSDAMSRDFLQEQANTILIIVLISIGLSALAALLLALHFRRPIHRLVDGARALADGHFDTRLSTQRSDELGELAHSFNQLAEKLALAEQSRRQWVADTSHELRTPISVLRAQLEALQDGIRSASPENIALMLRQVLSLNKLIDELYALSKADVGTLEYQMQTINLADFIQQEADNFHEKILAADLELQLNLGSVEHANEPNKTASILADSERLRQVLHNLFENSLRYTDAGGCIRITLQAYEHDWILRWEDSAPAVPNEALSRLGERFYRIDNSRNRAYGGSGLGLALCRRILEAHQANIHFSASDLGGLAITMVFKRKNDED